MGRKSSMLYKETSKINWLLILQAWTMLWVVIGHSSLQIPHTELSPFYSDLLSDIAYSFHMPMFIFISGYLFFMTRINTGKSYWPTIKDKIIKLGIPYLFFTLIALVLKSIFATEMDRPTTLSFVELGHAFLYPDDGPVSGFWFLAVIMWCFLLYPLWKALLRNNITIICGLIVSLILCVTIDYSENNLFCFLKFLSHSFYFFLGIVACRYSLCEMKTPRLYIIGASSLMVYSLLFIIHINRAAVLIAVIGMLLSISLAQILNRFIPSVFSSFRKYTYQIYLMGIFFQIFTKILFKHYQIDNCFAYTLCVLSGLYLPVLISMVVQKINFAPLCMLIGMQKRNKFVQQQDGK